MEDNELSLNHQEAEPTYRANWSIFARRLTVVVLLVGLVAVAALVQPVLKFIILAGLLVFILSYPVRALEKRTRLSYGAAAAVVYLSYLLVAIAMALYLALPAIQGLTRLANQLSQDLPSFVEFLENYTPEQGWILDPETNEEVINLDFILEPLSRYARGEEAKEVEGLINGLSELLPAVVFTVADFVSAAIVVHLIAFFFLLEWPTLYNNLMDRLPPIHQSEYRILTGRLLTVWTAFFRGTVASAGLIGMFTGIQFLLLGIPGAVTVGLLVFATSLIPMLGGFISLPALVFITFTEGSTVLNLGAIPLILVVVAIHLVISTLVWQVFYPRQTGKSLNLPISLVVIGLTVGATVGGVLGILLAVPVLGSFRELVDFLLKKIRGGNPYPEALIYQPDGQ